LEIIFDPLYYNDSNDTIKTAKPGFWVWLGLTGVMTFITFVFTCSAKGYYTCFSA
jgi:hypothetical protein